MRQAIRTVSTVFVIVWIAFQQWPAAASETAKLLGQMEAAKPEWLPTLSRCPADVMPARETVSNYFEERCATTLERCLANCGAGDASDCYASALVLQKVRLDNPISQALFLRACALGVASGCTNRAAGMDMGRGDPCAIQTYERACDRNDPWACTMMGFHLVRGIGIAKDFKRARQVLSKSSGTVKSTRPVAMPRVC